ncbi:poly(A) polymerase, putative [Leishmania donovani]|uniref:Poly(A) polymerase, putative n=1 Tax=Leishmania donovani TaxID=5661 RepID=A0A3S7X2S4_LEIDO|nr:poly(A) polymerase, putative [Leishmania donovani]
MERAAEVTLIKDAFPHFNFAADAAASTALRRATDAFSMENTDEVVRLVRQLLEKLLQAEPSAAAAWTQVYVFGSSGLDAAITGSDIDLYGEPLPSSHRFFPVALNFFPSPLPPSPRPPVLPALSSPLFPSSLASLLGHDRGQRARQRSCRCVGENRRERERARRESSCRSCVYSSICRLFISPALLTPLRLPSPPPTFLSRALRMLVHAPCVRMVMITWSATFFHIMLTNIATPPFFLTCLPTLPTVCISSYTPPMLHIHGAVILPP